MTTPAPTVVKTITAAEIRDVTHYCHFIPALEGLRSAVMYRFPEYTPFELLTTLHAARAVKHDSHFSGFAPRENLSHVNLLSDGTLEVVMKKRKKGA
jgi:hypothetical protein